MILESLVNYLEKKSKRPTSLHVPKSTNMKSNVKREKEKNVIKPMKE